MKPLVFNKKSWHYWLANKFSNTFEKIRNYPSLYGPNGHTPIKISICSYMRMVIWGMFCVAFLGLLSLVGAAFVVGGLMYITYLITGLMPFMEGSKMGQTFMGVCGIMTISTAGYYVTDKIQDKIKLYKAARRGAPVVPEESNFISNAYRSWKDKTCVPVSFID
jgi:hypothetical protein